MRTDNRRHRNQNRPSRPIGVQPVYTGYAPTMRERLLGITGGDPRVHLLLAVLSIVVVILVIANIVSCAARSSSTPEAGNAATAVESSSAAAEASSSSTVATATGVASPWTDSGYFTSGDDTLDRYIKEFCDQNSTDGATFDENAYTVNQVVAQSDYVERANNQSPWGTEWSIEYAKQFFEEGNSGNCYNFAAVTQFVLRYFGYSDAEGQPCIVRLQSGDWGDHGLVFVTNKVDGTRCLVDDAMGSNGWMLDINAYDYDVRNIAQNATVKGNVDALDDDDNPTPIPAGELTG